MWTIWSIILIRFLTRFIPLIPDCLPRASWRRFPPFYSRGREKIDFHPNINLEIIYRTSYFCPPMKITKFPALLAFFVFSCSLTLLAQVKPIFENGEAQIVPELKDSANWIRHDLWVETEFDTDGDGKKDRMHVDVTRPGQTETEGLKLPIVYAS